MKVQFRNVGRDKRSWVATVKNERALLRAAAKPLLSRDVGIEFSADGLGGEIIVGGYRTVGTFEIVAR